MSPAVTFAVTTEKEIFMTGCKIWNFVDWMSLLNMWLHNQRETFIVLDDLFTYQAKCPVYYVKFYKGSSTLRLINSYFN